MEPLQTSEQVVVPGTEPVVVAHPEPNEGGRMKMVRRVFLGLGAVVLLAVGGVSALLYSPPSEATPKVGWTPASLSVEVGAGQSTTTQATFTATVKATNVSVWVVPELAPYVSVSPSSFPSLSKGSQYAVTVTFAAPADAPLGVLDGTIHLRQGTKTLAKPLPTSVEVVWPTFDGGEELGFAIQYPPGWQVQTSGIGVDFRGYVNGDLNGAYYMFTLFVRPGVNPDLLPVETWFTQYLPDLQSKTTSLTPDVIDGNSALTVALAGNDQYYMVSYVALGTDIVEIAYNSATPELLQIYEQMVTSLQLTPSAGQ